MKLKSSEELSIELDLTPERGVWIAAKVQAGLHQVAHITPIHVTVNCGGFHNPATVNDYLDLNEGYLQEVEYTLENIGDQSDHQAWRYKEGLVDRIKKQGKL